MQSPDGRAGLCYSFYHDPPDSPNRPFLPLAYNAGARWDRFDFSWPVIEPFDNKWNFGPHDTLVNDLHAAGMRDLVGILLWTPDWAARAGAYDVTTTTTGLDQRPPGWYAPVPGAVVTARAATAQSTPPRGLYRAWNDPANLWGNYVVVCQILCKSSEPGCSAGIEILLNFRPRITA